MSDEPNFYGFRNLPDMPINADPGRMQVWRLAGELMRAGYSVGARAFRCRVVSEGSPLPPYPHGVYMEGWAEAEPNRGPFDYPLAELPPPAQPAAAFQPNRQQELM